MPTSSADTAHVPSGPDPLAGLAAVLAAASAGVVVDPDRQRRAGVPEVVYAEGKTTEAAVAAVRALLATSASGRVLVTRVSLEQEVALRTALAASGTVLERARGGRTLRIQRQGAVEPTPTGGVVGLLTAGAADGAAADEAAWVAEEMGCQVVRADDVGVAGIHRLEGPLREIRRAGADVVVVAAGMDGALPSVVAGLLDVPVIGLPTAVGYGLGGGGVAALLSMLQTCAPGLAVVNIDNGVGAGATAGLIANRAAAARAAHRAGSIPLEKEPARRG